MDKLTIEIEYTDNLFLVRHNEKTDIKKRMQGKNGVIPHIKQIVIEHFSDYYMGGDEI